MEGYIQNCSDYKESNKYVTATNRVSMYVQEYYKQGGDIRSNIENKKRYTIPMPTDTAATKTTTESYFDSMVFKMEVNACVNHKYMLKDNI